ncbi:MAG: flagellin lysine-N-methylase [Ruminococcus sp.]|nr:flagellin lysine-N-methylase [Ruminococcus sp.]
MIFRTPGYYRRFRCIAGDCRDSCCIGWEIDIDEDTAAYYGSVEGDFGSRLRENISGGCFTLGEDERCPFLNSRNLCDIYTELGEEHLCQICSDHPRFYEWFGDVKEGGIGLSCEAAAALILSEDMVLAEEEIQEEAFGECDSGLHSLLCSAREDIFLHLQNEDLLSALCTALDYAEALQENIDNGIYQLPEWEETSAAAVPDHAGVIWFYTSLEQISPDWAPELRASAQRPAADLTADDITMLRRIAVYFIYRYFLKGAHDGEILSRVKLAAVSVYIIARLRRRGGDMLLTAKNYSKETEYCEENIEALCDAFYDTDIFTTSHIKGLLREELDLPGIS